MAEQSPDLREPTDEELVRDWLEAPSTWRECLRALYRRWSGMGRAHRIEKPIPMLLFCPMCSLQHIDAPNSEKGWTNPPHRSHECQRCGHVWRPADVATTGVAAIETMGLCDGSAKPIVQADAQQWRALRAEALIELARVKRELSVCQSRHARLQKKFSKVRDVLASATDNRDESVSTEQLARDLELDCDAEHERAIQAEAKLEGELKTANHWRARHSRDAEAAGQQSQRNWERAEKAERELSDAMRRVSELEVQTSNREFHIRNLRANLEAANKRADANALRVLDEAQEAMRRAAPFWVLDELRKKYGGEPRLQQLTPAELDEQRLRFVRVTRRVRTEIDLFNPDLADDT